MSIINMLQYSLYGLPTAISEIIQIVTSLKRIEKFLLVDEIKRDHITEEMNSSMNAIVISDGNFYWKRETKEKEEEKDKKEKK